MSEFQSYGFQTVERRLSPEDQKALRVISTRAEITSSSFTNSYSWGDLKADPINFMVKWFDLHVYLSNWGTRRFMVRLPKSLIDVAGIQSQLARFDDLVSTRLTDEHLIVDVSWTDEELYDEEWIDEEYWLPALAPIHADLTDGDLRVIYLIWLKALDVEVLNDSLEEEDDEGVTGVRIMQPDDLEPMAGIGPLNDQLQAFATFFRINSDLVEAAAERSPERRQISVGAVQEAIARMPMNVTSGILLRLFQGDPMALTDWRGEVRAALPREPERTAGGITSRTAAEILARSIEIRTARESEEAAQALAEKSRLAREVAVATRARLDRLAERGESIWTEIERRTAGGYNTAAGLIMDMRTLALEEGTDDEFARRLEDIRERHAWKPRFLERLAAL